MKFFERPLLIALGISATLLTVVIVSPLSADDLLYQSMALDFYRFGKIPYLGSWDQNFPGIILIHYIAIVLFGEQDISLRLFDVILQLGFVIFFYKLCRKWLHEWTAAIAVILYIFYYVTGRGLLYSERDVCGMMSVLVGLYFVIRWREITRINIGYAALIIGAFFIGFSIVIRPTFGLAYLLIGACMVSVQNPKRGNQWWPVLLYCIAGAVPFLILILFYSLIPGGLQAFYLATIRFNLDVYTAVHGSPPLLLFLCFSFWRGLLIPFAMLAWISLRKNSDTQRPRKRPMLRSWNRREHFLYWSLLFSFLLIAIIQQKYLEYHFAPFYILLCPFSAIGVEWLLEHIRGWVARVSILLILVSLYTMFMVNDKRELGGFVQALFEGNNPLEAAYVLHHSNPSFGAIPERAVVRYLSLPGNDSGSIEVCSFDPTLRAHLRRNFASPYILPTPIAWSIDGGTLAVPRFTNYQMEWRKAYLDSLSVNKPLFIILARNTAYWYLRDPYRSYLHGLPGFDSLLQASYRYDTAFGCYQMFRRKN